MMARWIFILLMGGTLLGFAHPTSAQLIDLRSERTVLSFHLGVGGGVQAPAAMGLAGELSTPYGLLVVRTVGVLEAVVIFPEEVPIERNYDLGVLYGWKIHWGADPSTPRRWDALLSYDVALSGAVGVAQTWFIRRGAFIKSQGSAFGYHDEYERLVERAVGFPYEIRLTVGSHWGGLSVSLFGNVNRVEPYRGFLIGAFLGHRN